VASERQQGDVVRGKPGETVSEKWQVRGVHRGGEREGHREAASKRCTERWQGVASQRW